MKMSVEVKHPGEMEMPPSVPNSDNVNKDALTSSYALQYLFLNFW